MGGYGLKHAREPESQSKMNKVVVKKPEHETIYVQIKEMGKRNGDDARDARR